MDNAKELYVAVMGEVAKPGTYHLDKNSLKLHAVVDRAGGFTSDASKFIRVIRQGRVAHKQIFSESVDSPLFAGDLLIAESKPSNDTTNRVIDFEQDPLTVPASFQEAGERSAVQIALLNVVDYPLVLKLKPEDANASKIIANLGQPIALLTDADVITPDRRMISEVAKQASRLVDGSVIVVKGERVNRSRLPSTLPKPIESEIAIGAQLGLIGSPHGQSQELRTLGERMASFGNSSFDAPPQFTIRSTQERSNDLRPDLTMPPEDLRRDISPSMSKSQPKIAVVPFTGSPQITNSSSGSSRSDNAKNDSIPEPDDSASENPSTQESATSPLNLEDMIEEPATSSSKTLMILIVSIGGFLVGAAVILNRIFKSETRSTRSIGSVTRSEEVHQVAAPVTGGQTAAVSLLERLIKNELAVRTEPIEFPEGLTLQGKIAAKPILRVDSAQSILKQNGPHFPSAGQTTSGQPANSSPIQEVISQLDTPETPRVRRPHFMGAEKQKVGAQSGAKNPPENITDGSASDRSKAPLAKALFELEQGGRS